MTEPGSWIADGRLDPSDYVEFVEAGESAVGQFECIGCSHRIMVRRSLPACMQCGGKLWESSRWTPFTALTERLHLLVDPEGHVLDRVFS